MGTTWLGDPGCWPPFSHGKVDNFCFTIAKNQPHFSGCWSYHKTCLAKRCGEHQHQATFQAPWENFLTHWSSWDWCSLVFLLCYPEGFLLPIFLQKYKHKKGRYSTTTEDLVSPAIRCFRSQLGLKPNGRRAQLLFCGALRASNSQVWDLRTYNVLHIHGRPQNGGES